MGLLRLKPAIRLLTCRQFSRSCSVNMPFKEGDKLPSVDLFEGDPHTTVNIAKECEKGKYVIFGVPGAFTPTCSQDHLPGFRDSYGALQSKGVKEVYCVAINDPFVMAAWGKSLTDNKIRMLADTCGALTKALDLEFDATPLLGNKRCKRFSMIVQDGVVKKINVEPDSVGKTCTLAPSLLKQL